MDPIRILIPGKPVAKGRPRAARTKNGVRLYTPEKTASYEGLVAMLAHEAMNGRDPLEGPCSARIQVTLAPPASASKKVRDLMLAGAILPVTKPDLDNLAKSLFDAMNGIVFVDDRQVCDFSINKHYGATPMVVVTVSA